MKQILFISLLCVSFIAKAQITHTVTFNSNDLHTNTIQAQDGNYYSKIIYPSLGSSSEIGKPELPVKYVKLIVPTGKKFTISLGQVQSTEIFIGEVPYPAQERTPYGISNVFTPPDEVVYGGQNYYPQNIVKIVGDEYFDGNKHILTIAVYPVQFEPVDYLLCIYNSITFTLYESGTSNATIINKTTSSLQSLYDGILKSMVDNPEDIAKYTPTIPIKRGGDISPTYLVVTSRQLVPAFEELAAWKRRKGLTSGIVAIEDILSNPKYSAGDTVSNIYDNAGKLRQYLSDAYINGTRFVLLGGDATVVPIRYANRYNRRWYDPNDPDVANFFNYAHSGDADIPTDLYFSDFNGNWNADGVDPDGVERYGQPYEIDWNALILNNTLIEYGDRVDYSSEIFVGRLLCKTTQEIANYTYKVLKYEQNPGNGNYSYLTRAFMTQADQLLQYRHANYVARKLPFLNTTILDESPSYNDSSHVLTPNAVEVVTQIKNYGLVSIFGHGAPTMIAVATCGVNGGDQGISKKQRINSLDNIDNDLPSRQDGNGFDKLTNIDYPSIFYTIACETMPFDLYTRPVGVPNMAESYTVYSKAGGVAYIGNTRYGFVSPEARPMFGDTIQHGATHLFAHFVEAINNEKYKLGVAVATSKEEYMKDDDAYSCIVQNLVGDPEVEMWTATPQTFSSMNGFHIGSDLYVYSEVDSATICVMSALDNGASYYQTQNSTAFSYSVFSNVVTPYSITMTKHNYIPYISPQDIYIQNKTLSKNAYIKGRNIYAGKNVSTTEAEGAVLLNSGAKITFDADNEVILKNDFTVEKGTELEIRTKK